MYWSTWVNRLAINPAQGAGGAGEDWAVGGHAHQGGPLSPGAKGSDQSYTLPKPPHQPQDFSKTLEICDRFINHGHSADSH
jgi:hypothetical protein